MLKDFSALGDAGAGAAIPGLADPATDPAIAGSDCELISATMPTRMLLRVILRTMCIALRRLSALGKTDKYREQLLAIRCANIVSAASRPGGSRKHLAMMDKIAYF
jgi:hypothetical protein